MELLTTSTCFEFCIIPSFGGFCQFDLMWCVARDPGWFDILLCGPFKAGGSSKRSELENSP
jgi:hypothetical protein